VEEEDLSEVEERDSSEDLRRSGGTSGEDVEDLRREKEEWICCCGEVGGLRGAKDLLDRYCNGESTGRAARDKR
jgi:hypothetical protein